MNPSVSAPYPNLYALVPCAGVGERSGAAGPKQYETIAGRSMIAHTLDAIASVRRIGMVLVVLSPDDVAFETFRGDADCIGVRCGGASRAQSVRNGLTELLARGALADDWVLVHDAARCLVRPAWIDALIDTCLHDPVGGLLAMPLADTLKAEIDGRAVATIDRRAKWQAQTPQMFRIGMLADALDKIGDAATDEASAIEAIGATPKLVAAPLENFKVTWPADFALAERLLTSRQGGRA